VPPVLIIWIARLPGDATTLILWSVPDSAMKKSPKLSVPIPAGASIDAAVAGPPSPANAFVPLPATVDIMPVIRLICLIL